MKTKNKTILAVILLVIFFAVAGVALIIWDPADLLRLRGVERAEGIYLSESSSLDGVEFTVNRLTFSESGVDIDISDCGSLQSVSAEISVSENKTILAFDYLGENYFIFCIRKSENFKLIGTTDCDYLLCSVRKRVEDADVVLGSFKAVKEK